ncbi:hypothetical protein G7Z17_g10397 [Cylindrodendrum hubeiense]|uniref:Uncharacterized protein n=1 Tax=Cylindrodendrum hubeiense TaxID=595255 RepID=A0A9P5GXS1_9HYPO|nr:hypothetical protein G7Z17_g10397 [Cylindrodendrum hubeiense]
MKPRSSFAGVWLMLIDAAASSVVIEGRALKPRQTNPVSTDLKEFAPDPNTDFLSVSGTETSWLPKVRIVSMEPNNGQTATTVTPAAVALYTGESGDLNYLIAPALRQHMEDIAEVLCGVPDVPVKRDQTFCSYPQSNLEGSLFDSVVQQLLNEITSLLYDLGISVPQAQAVNRLTVPKVAFMMVDNTIGSLRDDVRSQHPELFQPGTQWRFTDLQGILSEMSVTGDTDATNPKIIEKEEDHIIFEVVPDTQEISIMTIVKSLDRKCDTTVILQSDGAASDECGGKLPEIPMKTAPVGCPKEIPDLPDVTQDASFRVLAQRSTTGGTWREGLAMYGTEAQCPDVATRPEEYLVTMESNTLEPGAKDPFPLLQNSSAVINYSDFVLKGQGTNPCGLDTQFYFRKKSGSRFLILAR